MGEHNQDIFSGHYFSIFKKGRERPLFAACAPDLIIPLINTFLLLGYLNGSSSFAKFTGKHLWKGPLFRGSKLGMPEKWDWHPGVGPKTQGSDVGP